MSKLIIILGPTASGKSDFAVELAKKVNGEIVSADSRQVYKGLDIGTGKITRKEMKGVPHHLLDVVDPKSRFTVVDYVEMAKNTVEEIIAKGRTPIVVGGTGFYIEALVDGVIMPEVPPNKKLRGELAKKSPAQLYAIIKKLDPRRAKQLDPHNIRRLIRAIEIAKKLGKVPKVKKNPLPYQVKFIGINQGKEELRKRINDRLEKRLKQGMIEEAKRLHRNGISWKRMIELGLEYRYLAYYLQGKMTEQEMMEKLKTEIWKYARRQMTWFKRDKRISWIKGKSYRQSKR